MIDFLRYVSWRNLQTERRPMYLFLQPLQLPYQLDIRGHVWFSDLGDKFGDFGDEIWDLKGAGIFSISLLGEKIRHECARSFRVTSRPAGKTIYGERLDDGGDLDRLGSPWRAKAFGVLPAVRASKLVS
ncbi:hypothetical protein AVEN_144475-1 [Araneus ventricosus]|uniref:Uncharacterized protein n=1 Tax=Araneus ventricosus TaxID=182803 RepID=A0A4Y2WBX0_ARAVE|nr:hypothetical protein AVEN_144475-1 [Araneus ventricosus]